MASNINNLKYDNSFLLAALLFFNAHFFYIAPVKIYFDSNPDIGIIIKALLLLTLFFLALRNASILKKHLIFLTLIGISFSLIIFTKDNLLNVAAPIILGLALYRTDIPSFLNRYFVITNIFWLIYLIIFVFFYNFITKFDAYTIERIGIENTEVTLRAGLGFISPNNIGSVVCTAAIIACLVKREGIAIIYLLFAFLTFLYTDSRSILISTILIFLFIAFNSFFNKTKSINLLVYYGLILVLVLLALLTFFGVLDQLTQIDRILSHRLHYLHLILVPSIFGTIGVHALDTSLMDLLNKGGMLAFSAYVYASHIVMKLNRSASILVVGFLLLGLSENIINQYNILGPLIFLFYFRSKTNLYTKEEFH